MQITAGHEPNWQILKRRLDWITHALYGGSRSLLVLFMRTHHHRHLSGRHHPVYKVSVLATPWPGQARPRGRETNSRPEGSRKLALAKQWSSSPGVRESLSSDAQGPTRRCNHSRPGAKLAPKDCVFLVKACPTHLPLLRIVGDALPCTTGPMPVLRCLP